MAWGELAVAVVGATGLAGRELLGILRERQFPVGELRLLGSMRTAGREVEDGDDVRKVEPLGAGSFAGVDVAFFAAGPGIAGEYTPAAVGGGAVVVDVSSRFRLDPTTPLVVPEVNAQALAGLGRAGLVASPSSTAVGLAVALAPLAEAAGLRRVIVSTYQASAGAGQRAVARLARETIQLLNARGVPRGTPRHAFNCVPRVGAVEPGGATTHELLVQEEVRRLLGEPSLPIHVTAVRVPIFFGVGLAITVELERVLDGAEATEVLRQGRGLLVHEDPASPHPTPADVVGSDATHVGRVRSDRAAPGWLSLWAALDGVRKGSALNAVQIAEIVVRESLLARAR